MGAKRTSPEQTRRVAGVQSVQNIEVGLHHAVAVVVGTLTAVGFGEASAAAIERAPVVVALVVSAGVTPASSRRPNNRCDQPCFLIQTVAHVGFCIFDEKDYIYQVLAKHEINSNSDTIETCGRFNITVTFYLGYKFYSLSAGLALNLLVSSLRGERDFRYRTQGRSFLTSPPCHSPRSLSSLSCLTFTRRCWHWVGTY